MIIHSLLQWKQLKQLIQQMTQALPTVLNIQSTLTDTNVLYTWKSTHDYHRNWQFCSLI
jgi:hypothetical protein